MRYSLITLALAVLSLAACQKKDETVADPSKISFSIEAPSDNQVYQNGDTVFVKAAVSYISELHGYELKIQDTARDLTYFDADAHVHADNFMIDEYWVDTLSSPAILTITLSAEIDHDGNGGEKKWNIQCN